MNKVITIIIILIISCTIAIAKDKKTDKEQLQMTIDNSILEQMTILLKNDLEKNFEKVKIELYNKRSEMEKQIEEITIQNDVLKRDLNDLQEANKKYKQQIEVEKKIATESDLLKLREENTKLKADIEILNEQIVEYNLEEIDKNNSQL